MTQTQKRNYLFTLIGHDGRFAYNETHACADDLDALDIAYTLCDGHDVEVHDGDRQVARVARGSKLRQA